MHSVNIDFVSYFDHASQICKQVDSKHRGLLIELRQNSESGKNKKIITTICDVRSPIVTSEQHLFQTIVQFGKTIVLPRKLATGSIYDYHFCYCPQVVILFEVLRIVSMSRQTWNLLGVSLP